MGALERVMQLKKGGMGEQEIAGQLQQEGLSPKDITDALSQAKIKEVVTQEYPEEQNTQENIQQEQGEIQMQQEQQTTEYAPQPDAGADGSQQEYQENPYANAYAQTQQFSAGGYDTNTMIEISEQVFSEKSSHMQKKIDELNELKTIVNIKLEDISERLKRLENVIDKLQISVMEEVGAYGRNVSNLKKEVEMVEDSFSKIVNDFAEKSQRKAKPELSPLEEEISKPKKR